MQSELFFFQKKGMLIWNGCGTFSLAKRREKQKHLLDFSVVDWAVLDLVSMDVWKRCSLPSPLGIWAVLRDNCSKGSQSTPRKNENNLKTFMIIKTISHLKSQSQDSLPRGIKQRALLLLSPN